MSWTLSDIRTQVRALTRRSSTSELSNDTIDTLVNEYYRYVFPQEVNLDRLDVEWTQALAATDDGEYAVSTDIVEMTAPIILNGCDELNVYYNAGDFWRTYLPEEDYLTDPTLAVGTTDPAQVRNSAFTYTVNGDQYAAAAAETALSGEDVPQSAYGAWLLEIDEDGDITVTAAGANDGGYPTAAQAIAGLPARSADQAVLGFVTAICSSADFVPGTTELNAGADVTATFTDGNPSLRARPEAILLNLHGGLAYVRPKPNDVFLIKSMATLQRPTALSDDTDTPGDEAWGPALALGAAIKFLASKEMESALMVELQRGPSGVPMPGCLMYELSLIRRQQMLQQKPQIERAW